MTLQNVGLLIGVILSGVGFSTLLWLLRNQPHMQRFRIPAVCINWGIGFALAVAFVILAVINSRAEPTIQPFILNEAADAGPETTLAETAPDRAKREISRQRGIL